MFELLTDLSTEYTKFSKTKKEKKSAKALLVELWRECLI